MFRPRLSNQRSLLLLLTLACAFLFLQRFAKPLLLGATRILSDFAGDPPSTPSVTCRMANTADFNSPWLNKYWQTLWHEVSIISFCAQQFPSQTYLPMWCKNTLDLTYSYTARQGTSATSLDLATHLPSTYRLHSRQVSKQQSGRHSLGQIQRFNAKFNYKCWLPRFHFHLKL